MNICTIALICVSVLLSMGLCLCIAMIRQYSSEMRNRRTTMEKLQYIIRVYDIWMMVKQSHRSIADYLIGKDIHNIAIYGMADLGNRLYHELDGSDISISYGMDMYEGIHFRGVSVVKPIQSDGSVDAVVVTALTTFDIVKGNLEKLGYKNVIALDEILYDLV